MKLLFECVRYSYEQQIHLLRLCHHLVVQYKHRPFLLRCPHVGHGRAGVHHTVEVSLIGLHEAKDKHTVYNRVGRMIMWFCDR